MGIHENIPPPKGNTAPPQIYIYIYIYGESLKRLSKTILGKNAILGRLLM